MGMRDSTFADPAGLDDGNAFRGGPLMSAYDIAVSTRNALRVPALARLAASPSVSFTGPDGVHHTLLNHNRLVTDRLYPGATGFKTGFTNKAQHTLVATATRGSRTLMVVILGTYDAYGWATRLLDVGFSHPPDAKPDRTLPPVRVTTYSARALQFAALRRLTSGPPTTSAAPAETQAPATSSPTPSTGSSARVAAAQPAALAAGTALTAAEKKSDGGGFSGKTIAILIVVLVLATLYVLRVRAVRRARARRLARRRATRGMMRRGGLPVVDGRYRTGTRVGKPVESHVQIRRGDDDERATGSG
jgi:D-alanyl-D-alanine carboxypeptidase (penicillin-binding protein 5/6)